MTILLFSQTIGRNIKDEQLKTQVITKKQEINKLQPGLTTAI